MGCSFIVLHWLAPPVPFKYSFRDIFHSGFRSGLCLRCKCALSDETVFVFNTTKMLISDYFGVVYRIIDQGRDIQGRGKLSKNNDFP